ncbi:OTU6, partial [Symbiodinium natans]
MRRNESNVQTTTSQMCKQLLVEYLVKTHRIIDPNIETIDIECTKYIASERSYFEQFVAEPFEEFLARIQREGEWGDDVEIEALSEIYDCRVEIYASYGHSLMRTFHEACDAKWPQPVRLLYEGHAHYNSLAPRSGLCPIAQQLRPGEIEDAAICRSRRRYEAGLRREGVNEADAKLTEQEVVDESIRLSRLEFEHKSEAEMDMALQDSRAEWEKSERKRMEEEVVDAILQQS